MSNEWIEITRDTFALNTPAGALVRYDAFDVDSNVPAVTMALVHAYWVTTESQGDEG